MFELFKKFGLPATVAAVISALIAILPFLFKLDERYAKASELDEAIQKVDVKVNALNAEVGKLTGVTQVLVAVVSQKDDEPTEVVASAAPAASAAIVASNAPKTAKPLIVEKVEVPQVPTNSDEKKDALQQATKVLEASQRNIEQIKKF